jgi:hypothetical protein
MRTQLDASHRELRNLGYSVEQVIPQKRYKQMIKEIERQADSGSYIDLIFVDAQEALKGRQIQIAEPSTIVYARYTKKEAERREGLVHELHVQVRNVQTRKIGSLDITRLN